MQRKPNIKFKAGEIEKVIKEVERFNARVDYQKRKHPEVADILPDKISPTEFIKNSKEAPRVDMKRQLKSMNRFNAKTATPIENKKGLPITKWERKEYEYKHAVAERQKTAERKEFNIPIIKGDKKYGTGTARENSLQPKEFNIDSYDSKTAWELAKKNIDKKIKANYRHQKVEDYKNKYLQIIKDLLGESGDELYDFISRVPASELYKRYSLESEDELLQISFISDPLPADSIADSVLERWRNELGLEAGETWEDLEIEDSDS
jgi:hypothetical protein